jgi:hypothetical protein
MVLAAGVVGMPYRVQIDRAVAVAAVGFIPVLLSQQVPLVLLNQLLLVLVVLVVLVLVVPVAIPVLEPGIMVLWRMVVGVEHLAA